MAKRRPKLNHDDLAHFEDDMAAGAGIMQDMIRLYHAVQNIADADLRQAATRDVIDAFRSAYGVLRRNREALEAARDEKRGKS